MGEALTTNFALWAVFAAFWNWGFYHAFRDGEILGGPGKIMRATLPDWVQKPTFECPICMASIHGSAWFLYSQPWDFMLWILFIVSVSGFNYCLAKIQYE